MNFRFCIGEPALLSMHMTNKYGKKMKIIYSLPLMLSITISAYLAFRGVPDELRTIIPFLCLWVFFAMIYYSGHKSTITNKDPVIKIGSRTPYVIPILFFIFPAIMLIGIFAARNFEFALQLATACVACLTAYFFSIFLLIRELKRDFKKAVKEKNEKLRIGSDSRKKLLLINPVNQKRVGLSSNRKSTFPPLALAIIAALTPDDFHVELIDENFDSFQYQEANLVALTAFTSNVTRAYEIASVYKEKNIPVVMGGIHAFMMPDEALEHVDSVVLGEAENVWKDVIADFENGELKKKYQGTHLDLTKMVMPRRELFSDDYLYATVQTSRGCPMDCNFCSVTTFNGNRYRQRPYEDVLAELESIPQRQIFFIDDNILGYGKKAEQRAIKLFEGMIEKKLAKKWFCQTSLNFGSNEKIIKLAAKAGCQMVFIGLESPEKEELQEMNKKMNLKLDYEKAFKNINKYGIAVLGAFIYGTDTETRKSMIRKTDYILKNRIDVIDVTNLTPLVGTKLFKEFNNNNRLKYTDFPSDWDRYDMTELVFKPKKMSEKEYLETMEICSKKLNSRFTIYKKFIQTLIHTKNMEAAMTAYNSNTVFRYVSVNQ